MKQILMKKYVLINYYKQKTFIVKSLQKKITNLYEIKRINVIPLIQRFVNFF